MFNFLIDCLNDVVKLLEVRGGVHHEQKQQQTNKQQTKTPGSCWYLATKAGAVNMTELNIDRGMRHYAHRHAWSINVIEPGMMDHLMGA